MNRERPLKPYVQPKLVKVVKLAEVTSGRFVIISGRRVPPQ
jgi:hypothetical protein